MRYAWIGAVCLVGVACGGGGGRPGGLDGAVDGGARDASTADTGPVMRDVGTDAPPVDLVPLCGECSVDAQCGLVARCGPLSGGETVCLRLCNPEFNDCPRGFQCAAYAPLDFENVCLPIGEACCVDEDADGYGVGGSCMGPDCDDEDAMRYPSAPELCDGGDQDCDDAIDEMFTDCEAPRCEATGEGTFRELDAAGCASGVCVDSEPRSCGNFTCDGRGEDGDVCATSCAPEGSDDDSFCIAAAHCDGGMCESDFPDGAVCDEDTDCGSGNCENGFCCGAGRTCCNVDTDCPGFPGVGVVCGEPEDCQGTRGTIQCNTAIFACETMSGVPDDSACNSSVVADTCGTFRDIVCTGAADQPTPRCPSTCTNDAQCDDNAHCDASFCFPDLPDGDACDEPSDCASGHCQNGFCCATGDCCRSAVDCPGSYGSPATCDDSRACQGTRDAATCIDNQCRTQENVPDDTACTSGIVADTCGLYPTIRCTGALDQAAPSCPATCTSDSECDENAHCDGGMCLLDQPNGTACDEASDCTSNYCGNGFCCAGGDCCARSSDCPAGAYGRPSECLAGTSCQGTRRDPVCNLTSFQCQVGDPLDDDSGCNGIVSNDCGLYPSVSCTTMTDQPSNQAGRCATTCTMDGNCDPGAFCNAMMSCQSEGRPGDACTASNQCMSGLSCVDGVCCTSSCTGTCVACNVPGSEGTCSPVPVGQDPANECAGLDCSSYFAGFTGSTCFERADAPSSAVSCNGAGACQQPADVCPSQGRGDARLTCDASCQSPNGASCTGTAPPVCNNLTPGNQTCGQGLCQRTVPICVSGAPNTCVPGTPVAEVCNGLDDNCDGAYDNGLAGDGYEPNASCGEARALPEVLTDGTSAERSETVTGTVYYIGDTDVYRIYVREAGGADCITTCFDNERSQLTIRLVAPTGVGSYEMCVASVDCPSSWGNCVTVPGGEARQLVVTGRSRCCSGILCNSNNSENFYVRVRGVGAPAWSCQAYRLEYSGDEAC